MRMANASLAIDRTSLCVAQWKSDTSEFVLSDPPRARQWKTSAMIARFMFL